MKKLILYFTGILVFIFITLSLLDSNGSYVAERSLWAINKKLAKAARNPEAFPDLLAESIISDYRKFIKKYPKSELAPQAQLLIGRIHLMKKNFDSARKELNVVVTDYPASEAAASEALLIMGKSYEMQKNLPEAFKTYRVITEKYPFSSSGIQVPLYIAQYYQKQGRTEQAAQAYIEAVSYYRNLADKNPNTPGEYNALKFLSLTYLVQKRWAETINTAGEMLLKFPSPGVIKENVMLINSLSIGQLKNFDIPIGIYQKFIEKYPGTPIAGQFQALIDKMKSEKQKFNEQAASNQEPSNSK